MRAGSWPHRQQYLLTAANWGRVEATEAVQLEDATRHYVHEGALRRAYACGVGSGSMNVALETADVAARNVASHNRTHGRNCSPLADSCTGLSVEASSTSEARSISLCLISVIVS